MFIEYWKDIPGFDGCYQVSSLGRVRSVKFNKIVFLSISFSTRYGVLTLFKNGKRHYRKIHRLVAEAFIPNPNNLPQVNHKDENPMNNSVDNLEWCDASYNCNYGTRISRMAQSLTNHSVPLKYKAVQQFDIDGNFIKEYCSIKYVKEDKYNPSTVCNCCRGRTKTAYGFIWKYKNKEAS